MLGGIDLHQGPQRRCAEYDSVDFCYWPEASDIVQRQFGSDRWESRHRADIAAAQITRFGHAPQVAEGYSLAARIGKLQPYWLPVKHPQTAIPDCVYTDCRKWGRIMPTITPDPILKIATGFMAAKHLFAASEIGLFEALASGPASLEELAGKTAVPARTVGIRSGCDGQPRIDRGRRRPLP